MQDKLTFKQFLKRKTSYLIYLLACEMLEEHEADALTIKQAVSQMPKRSYYKDPNTGVIRRGLSFNGIRKLVKKYPDINTNGVRTYFGLA